MIKARNIIKFISIYFVSFVLIAFSITKFFDLQFQLFNFTYYQPLKDLSPMSLAWGFLGHSYRYSAFIGISEFLAGCLILFNRTRLIGLLIAAGIYLNVLMVDTEFRVYSALPHAVVEFIIIILLLVPYCRHLKKFFWDMAGRFGEAQTKTSRAASYIIPVAFILLVSVSLSVLTVNLKSGQDPFIGAYKIKMLTNNGATVGLRPGEFTKEPMLFSNLTTAASYLQMTALTTENMIRFPES